MAEQTQTKTQEREYTIPLRKKWIKKASYRRTGIAIKAIKQFIARHMKVQDRDITKVKIDPYLNNDVWFRGRAKPPAKVKVKAIKEGDIVKVTFAEMPEIVKFEKAKHERRHKPSDVKEKEKPAEEKKEEISSPQRGAPQQSEEAHSKSESDSTEKKDEKEKEQSVADIREKQAEQQAKTKKHLTKVKDPGYHRMAMRK